MAEIELEGRKALRELILTRHSEIGRANPEFAVGWVIDQKKRHALSALQSLSKEVRVGGC